MIGILILRMFGNNMVMVDVELFVIGIFFV